MHTFVYDTDNGIEKVMETLNQQGVFPYKVIVKAGNGNKVVFIVTKERGQIRTKRFVITDSEKQKILRGLMAEANDEYRKLPENEREKIPKFKFIGKYIEKKYKELNPEEPKTISAEHFSPLKAVSSSVLKNEGSVKPCQE